MCNICTDVYTSMGAVNLIPFSAQRRRWSEIVVSGLIIPKYQGAKPRTNKGFSFHQITSVIYFLSSVIFHGGSIMVPWTHLRRPSSRVRGANLRIYIFVHPVIRLSNVKPSAVQFPAISRVVPPFRPFLQTFRILSTSLKSD